MTPTFGQHAVALEQALREAVPADASELAAAARYVLGWEDVDGSPANAGGKRLRPHLALFAAEAFDAPFEAALPGAVAVELVHNFSLVHDEVQDHDAERHGRPTLWKRSGEAQAINAGDYLFTLASRSLTGAQGEPSRLLLALDVINRAIERMVAGQWDDFSLETRKEVTADDYLAMVAGKTGALLGAPLEIGAILAGANRDDARTLGRWGEQLGLAFQAQDDYLGIWGDPDLTGKSNTNDISRRKKTLPIILGLRAPAAANLVRAAYAAPSGAEIDVPAVVRALDACGAGDQCRAEAQRHAAEADRLLSALEFTEATQAAFRAVADRLVNRKS
jgi:geranylgeranyl diphosphate synthase type I